MNMMPALPQLALAIGSGSMVGLSLGAIGGGGSILAVPLMVYVVGGASPHIAIGTSAVAVAVNAAATLATNARSGLVKWRCATAFALAGSIGAFAGSSLGKTVDGHRLLALFAILMLVVAGLMARGRNNGEHKDVRLGRKNVGQIVLAGLFAGALSGFFGIGGGFLIVPGLMAATGMPILNAVASSLPAVAAFGFTTAANYAASGLVDWSLAAAFVLGGIGGGLAGAAAAKRLAARRGVLQRVLAAVIVAVGLFMLLKSLPAVGSIA
jgi:uncharacterized protein